MEFADAPSESNDDSDTALLQLDYGPYWAYDIPALGAGVQLGWLGESFPRKSGDGEFTSEAYAALSFDDSKWFKTQRPVLNPFVAYYQDLDDNPGGRILLGASHVFSLSEMGLKSTPVLKDIDVVPSFLVQIDNGEMDRHWKADWYRWGIQVSYDLSNAMRIPPNAGRFAVTGFVYYRDSRIDSIEDRFFGGVTLAYYR